ncbi:hypothetical protein FM120_08250 [Sphingobacterium faecium PCAi_F2.5]|nr:hypothetical protein FM120_08250 [Sphingobacterium faecium PCAi_F2.5]
MHLTRLSLINSPTAFATPYQQTPTSVETNLDKFVLNSY